MFKLPKEVIDSIKDYRAALDDYLAGRTSYARFSGVRVPWGNYSHRGGKVFMSRIRIPAGVVDTEGLRAIAYAAEKFGNGKAHLTTRQDIQLHEVKLEDTIKVIEYLKVYNLSPRGGGSNTVRNITACVRSGVCKEEVFDVRANAIALTEYLLSRDTSFNLPRKFKVGFSGCSADCAGCLANDVGLLAQVKEGKKGFKVYAGGGLGAESRLGRLLEDFIPEEELGYCVEALKNTYYKNGDRRNKHHNRLRFLIGDIGFDKFRALYEEELKALKENEHIVLRKIEFSYPKSEKEGFPQVEDKEYNDFLKYSIYPQRQIGLVTAELRIPAGDIAADKLAALADLEKDFKQIEFGTSINQNIFLCNIREADVYKLFLALQKILNCFLYPSTLLDVVCCKGALTCNLGLCNSPGLTEEIEKVIKENFIGKAVFKKINIRINGCPNSCGRHPLGLISLHGIARRVLGRPVPFYKLLLGGRAGLENTRLAKDTGILIPAKNVPLFLKDFVEKINSRINENADIYEFIEKSGESLAKETADKYLYIPSYTENKDFYIDWGKQEEFSFDGLGPGECGVGVLDMIQADLTDAKIALDKAKADNYSIAKIKQALFLSARALLVVKGSDPKDPESACVDFVKKFVQEDIAPQKYSDLAKVYASAKEGLSQKEKEEKLNYAKEFLDEINKLYKSMDSSLNFPKQKKEETAEVKKENILLDLKGTLCPMNYVKAKLFLENLNVGDMLDILLDEGEPINNVPKSLQIDGQEIIKTEKLNGFYKVTVKKKI
ncbi:MAG: sulfurtransferase TusA family protein [Candidatus Omnitrophota bacterium]